MDLEYIRLLMLYSDQKYPFEKAKSDPGLTDSVRGVKKYFKEHGQTRKLDHREANQIMLNEMNARKFVRDIDEDYTPKAEKQLNNIESTFIPQTQSNNLQDEIAMLKKQLQEKEAELRARSVNQTPEPPKKPDQGNGIIERRLEDTGYSDKINND